MCNRLSDVARSLNLGTRWSEAWTRAILVEVLMAFPLALCLMCHTLSCQIAYQEVHQE